MNLNYEIPKTPNCVRLNAGCVIATGRCIGPVVVRQYTEQGQLLEWGETCSKLAVQRLNLPLIPREGNLSPVVRKEGEKTAILRDILLQYLGDATLDPSTLFVESAIRGAPKGNSEAVLIIIDNDPQTSVSKG